jgi:hypothetical protein
LWRLRRGRRLVGRHRHGREFNPLRALLGLIMDDQSTTVCPLPSLFLGLKIAVRQGHRTPKGTMLRGAVLHCQFEREAKGGPPQRVGGSMPNTKHCPTLGFSGMSRVVLSVQFLRTKALLSLDQGAAEAEQFGTGRTVLLQWYQLGTRVRLALVSLFVIGGRGMCGGAVCAISHNLQSNSSRCSRRPMTSTPSNHKRLNLNGRYELRWRNLRQRWRLGLPPATP